MQRELRPGPQRRWPGHIAWAGRSSRSRRAMGPPGPGRGASAREGTACSRSENTGAGTTARWQRNGPKRMIWWWLSRTSNHSFRARPPVRLRGEWRQRVPIGTADPLAGDVVKTSDELVTIMNVQVGRDLPDSCRGRHGATGQVKVVRSSSGASSSEGLAKADANDSGRS